MFKKTLLMMLFSCMSLSLYARSGDRVGNGGDVVICGDNVEMLDLYEAKTMGYKLIRPEGQNFHEMLENLFNKRLKQIQPNRAQKYLEYLASFEKEANFMPGIKLNDVDDAGMIVIPNNCHLDQVAIQLADEDIPAGRKRFTVSLDLWNRLNEYNKMVLVLHEIIYREAIQSESSNSMHVRAMVAELLREEMDFSLFLAINFKIVPSDPRSSKLLEFKKYIYRINSGSFFEVNSYVNAYNEKTLSFKTDGIFRVNINKNVYAADNVLIREADGEILETITSENYTTLKLVRAGETFKFDKANATSDREVFTIYSRQVFSDNSFNLNLEYQNEAVKFTNVRLLDFYADEFRGHFEMFHKALHLPEGEQNMVSFSEDFKSIKSYKHHESFLVAFPFGEMNCARFESSSFNYISFYDCSKNGNKLKFLVDKNLVTAEIKDVREKIAFDTSADRSRISMNANFTFSSKVFLGMYQRPMRKREEFFLPAGYYDVRINNGKAYQFSDETATYTLDQGNVTIKKK